MTTAPTEPTAPVLALPAPHSGGCPFGPPPAYSEAAATAPMTRAELPDGDACWLVTGFAEVRTVLSDRRFSADIRHPAFPLLVAGAREELITDNPPFLRLDDPEHARQRRMVTGEFLVKRVEALRPEIQRIVDEALDRMTAGRTTADLVADFALPVPSLVICLLLGVPYEDHDRFQSLSRTMLSRESTVEQLREAQEEVQDYLRNLAARKRAQPEDDILSRLAARDDLTPDDVAGTGVLLLIAGHETTANMISLSTALLLEQPEQIARLADPAALPGAVEELLRLLTIVHTGLPRVALEDVELGGVTVRAGEGVIAMLSTANRDESVFGGADHRATDELDVTRDARRHLAFGFGVHQCLGQPLARAELQIALETLFRRLPGLRLTGEREFRTESFIYGMRSLPVTW
ncbi:cytochrome P450 [Streptomyces sp. CBMA123]|uniref:cytochrome P450 n=1 Tax=Streptomyces sp. CBMA123 TaxID=1896313 RepID=UPI0016618BCB|nr:cytochrome P450 [Streptomyces sp. CBMA123]MBD0692416.1 cytochrome [Streptomyces sp. CBMA123]